MPDNVNSELKSCPLCGVAVDSGPTGGIYIHHPIDPKNPWACNMANADIRVADWQNRPGEDAARLDQFEKDCKLMCPYCLGFKTYKIAPRINTAGLYVHYGERRSSDGVRLSANCSADALRRAWEERHNRKEEHGI